MKRLITSLCIMLVLSGCSASNGKSKFTAGEYEATSKGFGGDVTVKLKMLKLLQTMKHLKLVARQLKH